MTTYEYHLKMFQASKEINSMAYYLTSELYYGMNDERTIRAAKRFYRRDDANGNVPLCQVFWK